MGKENAQTLHAYNSSLERSIAHSTSFQSAPPILAWLDASVANLAHEAKILEIGSGVGRDALYIQSKGYKVQCSDAVPGFVTYMQKQGLAAFVFDVIQDPLQGQYDLIFSNAVLLHLTPQDMILALQKIFAALKEKGRFSFTLKSGEGIEWTNRRMDAGQRYFCRWQEATIRPLLLQTGFRNIYIEESQTSVHPDAWLHIRAFK